MGRFRGQLVHTEEMPVGPLAVGGRSVGVRRKHQINAPRAGGQCLKPPCLTYISWTQTPSLRCSLRLRLECSLGTLWDTRRPSIRGERPGQGWTGKEDMGGVKGNLSRHPYLLYV